LFVLEEPGRSLRVRDILGGRLSEGSVLEPQLSYDGRRIVFSYVGLKGLQFQPDRLEPDGDDRGYYHICTANVDGTGLRQITAGPYDDGSAYFEVPAGKPVLFQALDKDGMAYQTMRTITYVQPGEVVSCVGCHEKRLTTPLPCNPIAARRRPSLLEPGPLGGSPFSFVRFVQPVLEKYCVRCHGGEKTEKDVDLTAAATGTPHNGFTRSYAALTRDAGMVPRYPQRNQIQVTLPGGQIGARGSRLMRLVRSGHYEVKLSDQEYRILAAWIDLNAVFYGSYDPEENARELAGQSIRMPRIQ
jgi:cytochrome c553